jgi:hypothetical protein
MSTLKKLVLALSIIGVSTGTITTLQLSPAAASDYTQQNISRSSNRDYIIAGSHSYDHKRKRWVPGRYKVYVIRAHYDSHGRWIPSHYVKRWIPGYYIYID